MVTARLLPQRFCFDGGDKLFVVVDKGVKKVVPLCGRAAGVIDAVAPVRPSRRPSVRRRIVYGDGPTVAQTVIVADDCLKKLLVAFEDVGGEFGRTNLVLQL